MAVSADKFKKALDASGLDIEWMSGWKNTWHGMSSWKGKNGNPVALMLHHTAGASTDSTDRSLRARTSREFEQADVAAEIVG